MESPFPHPRTHPHTHASMHVTQRTNTCATDKTKTFSRPKIMLQKLHAILLKYSNYFIGLVAYPKSTHQSILDRL